MSDYDIKYIKYKNKYLNLKKNINGVSTGGSTQPTLIAFTAKWCGHCKEFMPLYDKLKEENKYNIQFLNYDSEIHSGMMTQYNIQGYPTIYLEKNNQLYEFNEYRNEENINNFIKTHIKKI